MSLYLIAGVNNEHPKEAMAWEAAGKSRDGLGFYDAFVGNKAPAATCPIKGMSFVVPLMCCLNPK